MLFKPTTNQSQNCLSQLNNKQTSHLITQPKVLLENSEQLATQTNNQAILAYLPEHVMSKTPTHLKTDKHHCQIH